VSAYRKPLPRLDDANLPFWEGARHGELRLQRCLDCGACRFPAARACVRCHGARSEWVATSGRGKVESFCVFHKGYFPGFEAELPYNVVVVALDEGVKLFSNLVGTANEAIEIGMAVEAVFEPATDAVKLVKFKPVATT
jgi:uncharacterized OB-fold protein